MRLVLSDFVSLDGVVQAPGGAGEDTDGGDPAAAVAELKRSDGRDLLVMGSAQLARTLVEAELVDEHRLLIEPVLLGGGKSVFPTDGERRSLELVSTSTSPTGVLLCVYRPAESAVQGG